jgi:tripartite-type tricarboxylate transporter receptor subunit TctC
MRRAIRRWRMEGAIRIVGTGLAALFLVSSVVAVEAQTFPSKPVTIIVPAPPGGTADIAMRIIAHKLNENLGQQIVVDNRPGAGGIIASQLAVKAAPDGHTVLMNYTSHSINPSLYKKLPYDSVRDFAPVTLLGVTPLVLVVHPSVPAKTISEFVAYAKANPGKLNYGSAAIGGASHLGGELLKIKAGIDIVHIPYKGGAAAAADLLSGQVQMLLDSLLPLQPHIKAGKVRALGVTSAKRTEISPDLPAIAETIPNYEACAWFGIMVPAATPRELVARLNAEFIKVLRAPEVKEKLTRQGFDAVGNSPEEYAVFLKSEMEKWSEVVRIADVKAQ